MKPQCPVRWLFSCVAFAKLGHKVIQPQLISYSSPNLIDFAQWRLWADWKCSLWATSIVYARSIYCTIHAFLQQTCPLKHPIFAVLYWEKSSKLNIASELSKIDAITFYYSDTDRWLQWLAQLELIRNTRWHSECCYHLFLIRLQFTHWPTHP